MTCQKCNNPIPDDMLACPLCVREKSDAALREHQRYYLRGVAAGDTSLRVARLRNHEQHIELFGDDDTAFCGLDLSSRVVQQRLRLPYGSATMATICAECRDIVDRGVKEASE
jgi:hypothetical protein